MKFSCPDNQFILIGKSVQPNLSDLHPDVELLPITVFFKEAFGRTDQNDEVAVITFYDFAEVDSYLGKLIILGVNFEPLVHHQLAGGVAGLVCPVKFLQIG